jgi:hypothetical protein
MKDIAHRPATLIYVNLSPLANHEAFLPVCINEEFRHAYARLPYELRGQPVSRFLFRWRTAGRIVRL